MANWNSTTGKFTKVVGSETKEKEVRARKLRDRGYTVKEIAEKMGLSTGRIYEYFR